MMAGAGNDARERAHDADRPSDRSWAILIARVILGLIFGMAGAWKVFQLGPLEHARRLFVVPYASTYLPTWALWITGTIIPFVELAAGVLVIAGLWRRAGLLSLGAVLVLVTFGHLVVEPLYEFHSHVIPRAALLIFVLAMPRADDWFALDAVLARRSARRAS